MPSSKVQNYMTSIAVAVVTGSVKHSIKAAYGTIHHVWYTPPCSVHPTMYGVSYLDVHRSVLPNLAVHLCWGIEGMPATVQVHP